MMAILACIVFTILAIIFFFFLHHIRNNNGLPWNWPLLGMLPTLFFHQHRFHDRFAEIIERSKGTILFKYAWFANMDVVLTSNPANVNYIMSTEFSTYPKGSEWRKRFDIFGDALFNSDFEQWQYHRKIVRAFLSHQNYQRTMANVIHYSITKRLIPFLDKVSEQESLVDLNDLFRRHMSYFSCMVSIGYNPDSLPTKFPANSIFKAIDDACEAIIIRHMLPDSYWKLQRWLGLGKEKKMSDASETLDHILAECTSMKREELSNGITSKLDEGFNALEGYLTGHEASGPIPATYNDMKDNVFGLMFATQDTTAITLTWFFWLLSKNPLVEMKIRKELQKILPVKEEADWLMLGTKDYLDKMVYLQAALCETLRLFPPVPFQARTPIRPDTLPSGHHVSPTRKVIIATYAMGRMASVWGEDCHEFKPERWITEDGGIIHEPPHKFFSFNAGPRICPGKDIAFTLLKTFAGTIIHKYHVQVLENQPVIPKISIVLQMKHGLVARIKKRCD